MQLNILFSLLAVALTAGWPPLAPPPQRGQVDETRDAFLITRKKVSDRTPTGPTGTSRQRPPRPLGLGYTLYQKDPAGKSVRVDLLQEFRARDAVRLVIEANTDGYLYVFHTENDRESKMIFPDARLHGGANYIRAHVPSEVPSSQEADPRFRWFYFDEKAATERLYLVVARKPLSGVLTGQSLVAYCRANPGGCPWRPAEATWSQLAANVSAPTLDSVEQTFGQAQTAVERDAVERGLGLPPGAPAPSVVKIGTSPKAVMLVTTFDLIHK
jgi:Domain of unknown function (DUF4384)